MPISPARPRCTEACCSSRRWRAYGRAYQLTATRHEGGVLSRLDLLGILARRQAVLGTRAALRHPRSSAPPWQRMRCSRARRRGGVELHPRPAPQTSRAAAGPERCAVRPAAAAAGHSPAAERHLSAAANHRVKVARGCLLPDAQAWARPSRLLERLVPTTCSSRPACSGRSGPATVAALSLFDGGKRIAATRQARRIPGLPPPTPTRPCWRRWEGRGLSRPARLSHGRGRKGPALGKPFAASAAQRTNDLALRPPIATAHLRMPISPRVVTFADRRPLTRTSGRRAGFPAYPETVAGECRYRADVELCSYELRTGR